MAVEKRSLHAHGCVECGARYEDNCKAMETDAKCFTCRTGQPSAVWTASRAPVDCCRYHSRVASKEELKRYCLAGASEWFICTGPRGCYRTHPFDPTRKETDDGAGSSS